MYIYYHTPLGFCGCGSGCDSGGGGGGGGGGGERRIDAATLASSGSIRILSQYSIAIVKGQARLKLRKLLVNAGQIHMYICTYVMWGRLGGLLNPRYVCM